MKHLNLLLCCAALALSTAPVSAQSQAAPEATATQATMLTVHVKGMVCDFCARAVTKVFSRNKAVDGVHVDLDSGEIHVGLKPGMMLADDEVEAMVKKSGYAMVSVEREAM